MEAFNNFLSEVVSELDANQHVVRSMRLKESSRGRKLSIQLHDGRVVRIRNLPVTNEYILLAASRHLKPQWLARTALRTVGHVLPATSARATTRATRQDIPNIPIIVDEEEVVEQPPGSLGASILWSLIIIGVLIGGTLLAASLLGRNNTPAPAPAPTPAPAPVPAPAPAAAPAYNSRGLQRETAEADEEMLTSAEEDGLGVSTAGQPTDSVRRALSALARRVIHG